MKLGPADTLEQTVSCVRALQAPDRIYSPTGTARSQGVFPNPATNIIMTAIADSNAIRNEKVRT